MQAPTEYKSRCPSSDDGEKSTTLRKAVSFHSERKRKQNFLRMFFFVVFAVLAISAAGSPTGPLFSFSPPVGSGSGSPYLLAGKDRITGVRVWDAYNSHIYGLQLRFGSNWSNVAGYQTGDTHELELYEDETIVEISGKYTHYVQTLVFTTSLGRTLRAGQPGGQSFNLFPENEQAELVIVSGRYHGGLTSIGAHWAVLNSPS